MIGRPRSAITHMTAYRPGRSAAQAEIDHGVADAIKLASNEAPYGPLPSVSTAIASAAEQLNRYPDHRATRLRTAIAARHELDPDRVTVGCGSVGLLQQLALTYLDPGDPVVHGWPSFEAYPVFATLTGAAATMVPLRRLTNDLAGHLEAVDERTKLVLLANPNNPTGTALGIDDIIKLLDTVPATTIVVLDEAYREFVTSAALPDTVPLLDRYDNLVILRTFSKAHGLASLRVGYGFGNVEVINAIDRTLIPFAVNGPGQAAALASLGAHDELVDRVERIVTERRRVERELRVLGWSVPDGQANFVWLPAGDATEDLTVALEQDGVVTRGFPGTGARVTIAEADENDRFLETFERVAGSRDAVAWGLPTGRLSRRVQSLIDDLRRARHRLDTHAAARRATGFTDADPVTAERWDEGQVWAHLAEFGSYWLPELQLIVDARSSAPTPFGRTKSDPHRVAMIERHRHGSVADHLAVVHRDMDALEAELAQLDPTDWTRVGRHETLGDMDLWQILDEFAVGHYHEHADQLDGLRR